MCRQKKVTKEKATPTFAPVSEHGAGSDPRFEAKTSRDPKLAALKQRTASSTLSLQISGANTRGYVESIFDRFTINITHLQIAHCSFQKLAVPIPKCTSSDLDHLIDESGFPFEIDVANALQNAGFELHLSQQYFNSRRQRAGEIDLLARRTFIDETKNAGRVNRVLELIIECKDNSLPYVLFGFPAPREHDPELLDGDIYYNRVRTFQDAFTNQLSFVAFTDKRIVNSKTIKNEHHQFANPFRFHQASSVEIQSGKLKLNVSDRLRESLHGLASYIQHLQETVVETKRRGMIEGMPFDPTVWISFLLLIHRGDHYQHFGLNSTRIAVHTTLHTSLQDGDLSVPYAVDFVKFSSLPEAIVKIEKTFHLVSHQIARYLEPSPKPYSQPT